MVPIGVCDIGQTWGKKKTLLSVTKNTLVSRTWVVWWQKAFRCWQSSVKTLAGCLFTFHISICLFVASVVLMCCRFLSQRWFETQASVNTLSVSRNHCECCSCTSSTWPLFKCLWLSVKYCTVRQINCTLILAVLTLWKEFTPESSQRLAGCWALNLWPCCCALLLPSDNSCWTLKTTAQFIFHCPLAVWWWCSPYMSPRYTVLTVSIWFQSVQLAKCFLL